MLFSSSALHAVWLTEYAVKRRYVHMCCFVVYLRWCIEIWWYYDCNSDCSDV